MTQGSAKNASVSSGPAGGDLGNDYPNPKVTGLQNHSVNATTPTDKDVLTWDQTDGYWKPAPIEEAFSYTCDLTAFTGVNQFIVFPADGPYSFTMANGTNVVLNKLNSANEVSTSITSPFSQPLLNNTVNVAVTSSSNFAVNFYVYNSTGGFYKVTGIPDGFTLTLKLLGTAVHGVTYAAPSTSISGTVNGYACIVNGVGLVFQSSPTGDWHAGGFTAPVLLWNIDNYTNGQYDGKRATNLWHRLQFPTVQPSNNYNSANFGWVNDVTNNLTNYAVKKGFWGTSTGWYFDANLNGTPGPQGNLATYYSDDVGVLVMPNGPYGGTAQLETGVFGTDWPNESTLNMNGTMSLFDPSTWQTFNFFNPPSHHVMATGAENDGSPVLGVQVVYTHVRIDLPGKITQPLNIGTDTLNGVVISGTPVTGQNLVATSSTTATWENVSNSIIFDSGTPSENLRTNRSTLQSPIDTTKEGIVNLSTDTTQATTGVTSNFSTISGGDQNVIQSDHGTIGGGLQNSIGTNSVPGHATIAGGAQNTIGNSSGETAIGGGFQNTIGSSVGWATIAGGTLNAVNASHGAISGGQSNTVNGDGGSITGGNGNIINVSGSNAAILGGAANTVNASGGVCLGGTGNIAGPDCMAGGFYSDCNGVGSVALGWGSTVTGEACASFGYRAVARRFGQMSFSSCGSDISVFGDAQNGNVVYSRQQPTPGSSFVVWDALSTEFTLFGPQYYSISIRIITYANNAAVGPATWVYELSAYTVAGVAVIAGTPQQMITTPDPNATGWLSSVTVDGTTNLIHVNINPNGDVTNTINAVADIKWAEIIGFSQ